MSDLTSHYNAIHDELRQLASNHGVPMETALQQALSCGRSRAARLAKTDSMRQWGMTDYFLFCGWLGVEPTLPLAPGIASQTANG